MKKLSFILAVTSVCFLFGCTTAKPLYTAQGKEGYAISCSGVMLTWSDCYTEAGQKCATRGYTVQSANGEAIGTTGAYSQSSGSWAGTGGSYSSSGTLFSGTGITRDLVVQCN